MAPRDSSRTSTRAVPFIVATGLVISACSDTITTGDAPITDTPTTADSPATASGDTATLVPDLPPRLVLDVPDPNSVYDPVRGGETLPEGFRQLLGRDDIAPVYDPSFTTAAGVDWPEESLVIGVDLAGEARAYPVGFLNRREIVNDDHRGIPTLVTW